MGQTAFLDACVLFPSLVRHVLLNAAAAGLFTPYWSPRVLDEWQIAIARRQGAEAEADVIAARAAMANAFPTALIDPDPQVEADLNLPDPSDIHVAAAAARTDILLTFNLGDFPRSTVSQLGFQVRHPDGFLWELWSARPKPVTEAVEQALAQTGIERDRLRTVLKRARLSRLGKAIAQG